MASHISVSDVSRRARIFRVQRNRVWNVIHAWGRNAHISRKQKMVGIIKKRIGRTNSKFGVGQKEFYGNMYGAPINSEASLTGKEKSVSSLPNPVASNASTIGGRRYHPPP